MLPSAKLDALISRHATLERELSGAPDRETFVKLSREFAELQPLVETVRSYRAAIDELGGLEALLTDPATEPEMRALAQHEKAALNTRRDALEQAIRVGLIPKDAADERNVILEIRAGTGGDEAARFAGDLFRMYERYAARQGWKVEVISASEGSVGGFKEVIAEIRGRGAFAKLKYESGVHRVQRVPLTEASGRIHTSTATVAVLPEAEDVDVELADADLRIDTMRAGGAGGQHVNKTESAVRITHLPSGIVVACQNERSQHKNRSTAMKMLRAKLYELEVNKRNAAARVLEESKSDVSWGNQIRSYVLDQSRIKDLRTGVEVGNTGAVLDGDLDPFLEASLKAGI